jgi:hypothetical protein
MKHQGISVLIFAIKDLWTTPSSSSSHYMTPESIHSPDVKQILFPCQYYERVFLGPEQTQVHAPTPSAIIDLSVLHLPLE